MFAYLMCNKKHCGGPTMRDCTLFVSKAIASETIPTIHHKSLTFCCSVPPEMPQELCMTWLTPTFLPAMLCHASWCKWERENNIFGAWRLEGFCLGWWAHRRECVCHNNKIDCQGMHHAAHCRTWMWSCCLANVSQIWFVIVWSWWKEKEHGCVLCCHVLLCCCIFAFKCLGWPHFRPRHLAQPVSWQHLHPLLIDQCWTSKIDLFETNNWNCF